MKAIPIKPRSTIYVCSPYSSPSPEEREQNAEEAIRYCRYLASEGFKPVAPHLFYTRFMDDNHPDARTQGLAWGLEDLKACHALLVLGDTITEGMAGEISEAAALRLPIIWAKYNTLTLIEE